MYTKCSGWSWMLVAVLSLALIFPASAEEEPSAKEKKVAIVNGTAIIKADFDREMNRAKQRFAQTGKPLKGAQLVKLKKRILEDLIDQELLYQGSQNKKIKVDQSAINKELDKLKKRFPSEAEFKSALKKIKLTAKTLKFRIERGIAIQQFIEKEFAQKVTISEQEMKSYYDENPKAFKQPEKVQCRQILIKVNPKSDQSQKDEARQELEKVQEKLQEGEDFAALAKEFSQGPRSTQGGNLGYLSRERLPKLLEEVAFSLKTGEVSDIVETQFGCHLIKVSDKKPETTTPYNEAKDKIKNSLKQEEVRKLIEQYLKEQKKQGDVKRFLERVQLKEDQQ